MKPSDWLTSRRNISGEFFWIGLKNLSEILICSLLEILLILYYEFIIFSDTIKMKICQDYLHFLRTNQKPPWIGFSPKLREVDLLRNEKNLCVFNGSTYNSVHSDVFSHLDHMLIMLCTHFNNKNLYIEYIERYS